MKRLLREQEHRAISNMLMKQLATEQARPVVPTGKEYLSVHLSSLAWSLMDLFSSHIEQASATSFGNVADGSLVVMDQDLTCAEFAQWLFTQGVDRYFIATVVAQGLTSRMMLSLVTRAALLAPLHGRIAESTRDKRKKLRDANKGKSRTESVSMANYSRDEHLYVALTSRPRLHCTESLFLRVAATSSTT